MDPIATSVSWNTRLARPPIVNVNTALPDAGVATGVFAYSPPDTKVTEVIQPLT